MIDDRSGVAGVRRPEADAARDHGQRERAKLRLFAVACCRRVVHCFTEKEQREAEDRLTTAGELLRSARERAHRDRGGVAGCS